MRESAAVAEHHHREVAADQPRRRHHDAVEHRLRINSRTADDAQNFRRGGLSSQRLGEFPVTLGERGEQSLARRFGRLSRGGGNSARQRYCLRLGGHRKGKGIRLPPPLKASLSLVALREGRNCIIRDGIGSPTLPSTSGSARIEPPVRRPRKAWRGRLIREGVVTPAKRPLRGPPESLNIITFEELMAQISTDREDR